MVLITITNEWQFFCYLIMYGKRNTQRRNLHSCSRVRWDYFDDWRDRRGNRPGFHPNTIYSPSSFTSHRWRVNKPSPREEELSGHPRRVMAVIWTSPLVKGHPIRTESPEGLMGNRSDPCDKGSVSRLYYQYTYHCYSYFAI